MYATTHAASSARNLLSKDDYVSTSLLAPVVILFLICILKCIHDTRKGIAAKNTEMNIKCASKYDEDDDDVLTIERDFSEEGSLSTDSKGSATDLV